LLFAPAALGLAALAGALVLGFDPVAFVRPWLRPDDAAGAATLAAAARAATPWLVLLALVTAAATPLVARAAARAEWRRIVLAVAALFALWSASFNTLLHPAIARERSLKGFFAEVARSVPPGTPLYALYPPDPGLRFYAPPTLREWPHRGAAAGAALLLWEDEWQRLRDGRVAQPVKHVAGVEEGRHLDLQGHAEEMPLVDARAQLRARQRAVEVDEAVRAEAAQRPLPAERGELPEGRVPVAARVVGERVQREDRVAL